MSDIGALTPERAQRALLILYDLVPEGLWEGGQKPSFVNIGALAERIEENAPADVTSFLSTLRGSGGEQAKGEAAKAILQTLREQDSLRTYVEQAVANAAEPHMSPIPPEIVAFVLTMAVLSMNIEASGPGWKLSIKGRAPELMGKLTGFVKALPTRFWGKARQTVQPRHRRSLLGLSVLTRPTRRNSTNCASGAMRT